LITPTTPCHLDAADLRFPEIGGVPRDRMLAIAPDTS
jgi:hypothetical protein